MFRRDGLFGQASVASEIPKEIPQHLNGDVVDCYFSWINPVEGRPKIARF
jgi:hypothetical protein